MTPTKNEPHPTASPDPVDVFKKVKACVLRFFRPPGSGTKPYPPGVKPSDKMGAPEWNTMAKKIAGCIVQAIPTEIDVLSVLKQSYGKTRSEFIEDLKQKIVPKK